MQTAYALLVAAQAAIDVFNFMLGHYEHIANLMQITIDWLNLTIGAPFWIPVFVCM